MLINKQFSVWTLLLTLFFITKVNAKQVTDQLYRTVNVPDHIERVVVLQHETLNLLVQLNQQDKIVGVLSSWKKRLGEHYLRLAPSLKDMPTPGDLTSVDLDSLEALNPQVVFVTNYVPAEMIQKIERLNIPVVAISLRKDYPEEAGKINPEMIDEEYTYDAGLKIGVSLIGEVMDADEQAQELLDYTFTQRKIVSDRLKDIDLDNLIRAYVADPELTTYGAGQYAGLMLAHAGAFNVAAASFSGVEKVSIKNIIQWDPQVILVKELYPYVVDQILTDQRWQNITAVKDKKVYLMPEYAKAWGYPMPESLAIGELWLAKTLYSELFSDIDMQQQADAYYQRFYRTNYQGY